MYVRTNAVPQIIQFRRSDQVAVSGDGYGHRCGRSDVAQTQGVAVADPPNGPNRDAETVSVA